MQAGWVELQYRRREDDAPVTMVAPLSPVRALVLGGRPGDLPLPGASPDAVLATIEPTDEHFLLKPGADAQLHDERPAPGGETKLLLSGRPVRPDGAVLEEGDELRLGPFELTFHEGGLPEGVERIDTFSRWSLLQSEFEAAAESSESLSNAYIEDFELTIRPLLQLEHFAEVQEAAEQAIRQGLRHSQADVLDEYIAHLWLVRVRMAREANSAKAGEIAREAFDLFPEHAPTMVACATTFLIERDWELAERAFERALRRATRRAAVTLHDARLGLALLRHVTPALSQAQPPNLGLAHSHERLGWDFPVIRLSAPGDELLLWRMAWFGRLFGAQPRVRFVYFGRDDGASSVLEEVLRWEVQDLDRGRAWRWRVGVPTLPFADPSLAVEVHALRNLFSQHAALASAFVEATPRELNEPRSPLVVHEATRAFLAGQIGRRGGCARVSGTPERVEIHLTTRPAPDDIVVQQGTVYLAISEPLALALGGESIVGASRRGLRVQGADGQSRPVRYRGWALLEREYPWWLVPLLVVGVVVIVGLVRRALFPN
jgi:hypothetical protein